MIPSWDHTGTFHFHSSTTSGSASLIRARSRASVLPRQSLSSLIRASIVCEGDLPFCVGLLFIRRIWFTAIRRPYSGGHGFILLALLRNALICPAIPLFSSTLP